MNVSREWHSGPPPSLGWWPASTQCNIKHFRWWDGRHWSFFITASAAKKEIERIVTLKSDSTRIMWHDRPDDWPERSRT